MRSGIYFNSKFKTYWREGERTKIKIVTEHVLTSIGRVCGKLGITGLPSSVRTAGWTRVCYLLYCCGLCLLPGRELELPSALFARTLPIYLVGTPTVCIPDALRSVVCTLVALRSRILLMYVCDPALRHHHWSRSAAVPPAVVCSPAVPAVVSWRYCGPLLWGSVLLLLFGIREKGRSSG